MSSSRSRSAPPRASAMLESLRGLGYTPATAIADIIDNSITARAKTVEILAEWRMEKSSIRILDDGDGMTPAALDSAMRLGARNPLDPRDPQDLGRFGFGLKTASFSQCRCLTVASRRGDAMECLRWDLDYLADSPDDGWHLLEGPAPGSEGQLEILGNVKSGTLVVWERLDRIVTDGYTVQDFLDLLDSVERHLAMVFHRYLEGPSPRLQILINGRAIRPWDPFLRGHTAVIPSPEEPLRTTAGEGRIQTHVLPHKDKMDRELHDHAAGPDGWTAQQGFYVYRNERLLVAGSWLGLGPSRPWCKEEAYRLARIRVDIPNTADAEWKIDIRKSEARPPASLRPRLTRIAEDVRSLAKRVFAHRGEYQRGPALPVLQAWRAERTASGTRYRIDENHPAVRHVIDQAGPLLPALMAMLRVIEETVPVQRIWLDTTEEQETPLNGFAGAPSEVVMDVLGELFQGMLKRGMSVEDAREKLMATEPFQRYPELVAGLGTGGEKI